jgi:hypothetical protein
VYTNKATRAIFDRLAHSSIMRLNKTSMDKLYDLMTMGFKHQLLRCIHPAHLMQVTLNHLESIRKLIFDMPPICELLDNAIRSVIDTYSGLKIGELWGLKHALGRFFQDRRVKVSLFLQDGLQGMDGTLVLDTTGPLPAGTEPPGTIRYFEPGTSAVARVERLPAIALLGATVVTEGSPFSPETRLCKLGENLYAKERKGKGPPPADTSLSAGGPEGTAASPISEASKPAVTDDTKEKGAEAGASKYKPEEETATGSGVGRAALDLLAALVGGKGSESKEDSDTFKFSLFGDDGQLSGASGGGAGKPYDGSEIITFDAGDKAALSALLRRIGWHDDDATAPAAKVDDGDDLLSLLDEAGMS